MEKPAEAKGLATRRRDGRLARLEALIREGGPSRLNDAAERLGVSPMTLRRDLAFPGAPLSLLGGHILPFTPRGASGYALKREAGEHVAGKRRATRLAASFVRDGDTLFVDCGTTMPHLVEALPADCALTIICYALNIATLVCRRPNTRVVLLGGVYNEASATFASDAALGDLARLRVNLAFISAAGVHPTGGATCVHFNEAPVKQAAIELAERAVLAVDGSKLGRQAAVHIAPLDRFERIVVSPPEASGALDAFAAFAPRIVIAPER